MFYLAFLTDFNDVGQFSLRITLCCRAALTASKIKPYVGRKEISGLRNDPHAGLRGHEADGPSYGLDREEESLEIDQALVVN